MKKQFVLMLLFLAVTGFSHAQKKPIPVPDIPLPAEGKAAVYFMRLSGVGSLINFTYFDSATCIGIFSGVNYMRYECNPGKHIFWARSENKDFLEAEVEADKIYFIEAIPHMGALKAAVALDPIDLKDPKAMKHVFMLMDKKPAKTFTAQELDTWEKSTTDIVERGLAKYKEDKAKGKELPQVKKEDFYEGK